jgi:hypothetical protein
VANLTADKGNPYGRTFHTPCAPIYRRPCFVLGWADKNLHIISTNLWFLQTRDSRFCKWKQAGNVSMPTAAVSKVTNLKTMKTFRSVPLGVIAVTSRRAVTCLAHVRRPAQMYPVSVLPYMKGVMWCPGCLSIKLLNRLQWNLYSWREPSCSSEVSSAFRQLLLASCLAYFSALKMEASLRSTAHHIPELLVVTWFENLRSKLCSSILFWTSFLQHYIWI